MTKTKTIRIDLKGIPKVTEHITRYKNDETITFVSDKHASLAFDNYDVFEMDGVLLEAGQKIELVPKYPHETNIYVSVQGQQTAGAQTTGPRALMKVYCADPPKIVPGG